MKEGKKRKMVICPVCNNDKWRQIYYINGYFIERCSNCGFCCINPLPESTSRSEFYSEKNIVGNRAKVLTGSQKFSRKMKSFFKTISKRDKGKIFLDKLLSYKHPGARILDIGCGDGSFLKQASDKFDCTGIEVSEYLAKLGRSKGLNILTGNFQSADFGNAKYDGITLISLLEHLDDPEGAMRKCFNLLNKGGVLLIKTVNYGCINRAIKGKEWTGFRPPDHIVYFNPANLKLLLRKVGFSKIKVASWPFNDNMYCDAWK